MEKEYIINIKCVFCGSTDFKIPYEGYQPDETEMVECANCGKLNDYVSAREVVVDETLENEIKPAAKKYVEDEVKKMFKKFKF